MESTPHSPSGSRINNYLTGEGAPEVPRRGFLGAMAAFATAAGLAACAGNSEAKPPSTSTSETSSSKPTAMESVTPTPKEYSPEDYPSYSEIDPNKQYTNVPIWKTHVNGPGVVTFERSGCSSGGMMTSFKCNSDETEYFPAFTLQEMAEDCKKPETDEGRLYDRVNLRHFLLEVLLAEKHPNDPGFRGLGRYGNKDYDTQFSIEKATLREAPQRADNVWTVLGKEGQFVQGLAIDVRNGKVDKEQGDQILWLLCTAMTGDDNAANDLRDFVTKRAEAIKTPEDAGQCLSWWTSTKPTPADSIVGSYKNSNIQIPRAIQFRVPDEEQSISFVASTLDGVIFEAVNKGGIDPVEK